MSKGRKNGVPDKRLRDEIKTLERQGWTFTRVNGQGHPRLVHQNGAIMFLPTSLKDPRTLRNVRATARRLTA